jgi:hypothetical protein
MIEQEEDCSIMIDTSEWSKKMKDQRFMNVFAGL